MESENNKSAPGDYLANERTFLAWVRTSIGIMAFGFVVIKFSFFLRQFSLLLDMRGGTSLPVEQQAEHSSGIGIVLVLLGMIVIVLSYIRYRYTNKQLNAGAYRYSSLYISLLTAVIFLISMLLVYYLLKV